MTSSITLTFKGNDSTLTANFFPAIDLDPESEYFLGLIDFETYNSIPNIDNSNNVFRYFNNINKTITFPEGSYEITDIEKYLQSIIGEHEITLKSNNNTLKCELWCNYDIDFRTPTSIGPLLGFSKKLLKAGRTHISDIPVNINRVNVVRVECDIVGSSYLNGKEIHTIYQFAPSTSPGYKIIEVPHNVIYLPIKTKRLDTITVRLLDQDGVPINFRKETITVRLHLKKWGSIS